MSRTICYLAESGQDWGGASRVLFTNVRSLDRRRYAPLVLLPYPGRITAELDQLGVRYRIWGRAYEGDNPITYARAVLRSVRMLRMEQVDLLHFNRNYWRPPELIAAKLLGIPVLVHYHLVVQQPGPLLRMADGIVAVSRYVAAHSKPDQVKKYIIHNAVKLKPFDEAKSIRRELGISDRKIVVAFLGQIRRIKGIDMFLAMTKTIPDEDVCFVISGACRDPDRFGDAYTESELKAGIGGDERIIYLGYRSDVQNIYATSDMVVVPSQWDEPFGLINIEAGAAGKPVVATRVGGIPEVIFHGVNGFLVERDDLDGLSRYVLRLKQDRAMRLNMGRKAREVVERSFTSRPVEDLQSVYDGLTLCRKESRS